MSCTTNIKDLGRNCKRAKGTIVGFLISDTQQSLAKTSAHLFATYDAAMSAVGAEKMQFVKIDMNEGGNVDNQVATHIDGINMKTGITINPFVFKIAAPSPIVRKNLTRSFSSGRDVFFAPVYANGVCEFVSIDDDNFGLMDAHIMQASENGNETAPEYPSGI